MQPTFTEKFFIFSFVAGFLLILFFFCTNSIPAGANTGVSTPNVYKVQYGTTVHYLPEITNQDLYDAKEYFYTNENIPTFTITSETDTILHLYR